MPRYRKELIGGIQKWISEPRGAQYDQAAVDRPMGQQLQKKLDDPNDIDFIEIKPESADAINERKAGEKIDDLLKGGWLDKAVNDIEADIKAQDAAQYRPDRSDVLAAEAQQYLPAMYKVENQFINAGVPASKVRDVQNVGSITKSKNSLVRE